MTQIFEFNRCLTLGDDAPRLAARRPAPGVIAAMLILSVTSAPAFAIDMSSEGDGTAFARTFVTEVAASMADEDVYIQASSAQHHAWRSVGQTSDVPAGVFSKNAHIQLFTTPPSEADF